MAIVEGGRRWRVAATVAMATAVAIAAGAEPSTQRLDAPPPQLGRA